MVTQGVSDDSQRIMIDALSRMKITLTRDAHLARRPPDQRHPEVREIV